MSPSLFKKLARILSAACANWFASCVITAAWLSSLSILLEASSGVSSSKGFLSLPPYFSKYLISSGSSSAVIAVLVAAAAASAIACSSSPAIMLPGGVRWWWASGPVAPGPEVTPPVLGGADEVLALAGSADGLDGCDVLSGAVVEPWLVALPGTPLGSYMPSTFIACPALRRRSRNCEF
jgi:hypothetical protein